MAFTDYGAQLIKQIYNRLNPTFTKVKVEHKVAVENTTKTPSIWNIPISAKGKVKVYISATKAGLGKAEERQEFNYETAAATALTATIHLPPGWWLEAQITEATVGEATVATNG